MQIENLLRYWRHCLADGELSAPRQRIPGVVSIGLGELIEGRCNKAAARKLVDAVEAQLDRNPSNQRKGNERERLTIDAADVAIAPFRLRRIVEHSQSRHQDPQSHAPFWIAARLSRDGSFEPHGARAAWFVRDHLQPAGRNSAIVGTLDAMDLFLSRSPGPAPVDEEDESNSWSKLIEWVEGFFEEVTGSSLRGFQLDEHVTLDGVRVVPYSPLTGAGRHLLELYDAFLPKADEAANEKPSKLIKGLARRSTAEQFDPQSPLDDPIRDSHLGHMTDRFGLGPSQRESLHALLRLPKGELMALNGPPGTGKTAWIQSAVASLWVERALAAGEPPIVVATSTNNRAVTNILDTFQKASSAASAGLAERWLPRIDVYGLFLPSDGQSGKTKHRWAAPSKKWSGLPRLMEDWKYLEESEDFYLHRANSHYEPAFEGVEAVVEHLHGQLRATSDRMIAIHAAGEVLRSLRRSMSDPSPEAARRRLADTRLSARAALDDIEVLAREVDDTTTAMPLLEELLSFLPPIRDRRNHRFARLFERHGLPAPTLMGWSYRPDLEAVIEKHRRDATARLEAVEAKWRVVEKWEEQEQGWLARLDSLGSLLQDADLASTIEAAAHDPVAVESLLDRTLRLQLFYLAGRYWEGRWLLELRSLLEDSDSKKLHRQSEKDCLRRFQRFAMVTPLFVSTVYMLPKFFDCYERGRRPLIEGIDLLIFEEAGQVAPELGGVLLALAKRAVVLGDVFQIEPVWNIGRAIDDSNRQRHQAEAFRQQVFHSSRGGLMGIAQARSHYTSAGRTDGLWLREHRRCVPDVIAYCQDLVPAYREVLEPHRSEIPERQLPALGWAHVRSDARQAGSSWANPHQAEAIARWIENRQADLRSVYDRPIEKVLGIVTPYRAQVSALRRSLADLGIDSKLEIGTVHTFQGGELPVMLFSPVVTREQKWTQFFDRSVNMLNVAVSRAQDSFLVFGDMRVFDPASSTPSGILARHLLAEEANQLPDVDSEPELSKLPEVERISGLEEHRRILREAFEQAKQRLLIVSPYLTEKAIEAERLVDRIGSAVGQVSIAYSIDMAKPKARAVAERLEAAGAEIIRLRGFHTKTLAVDDSWYTHGSFNWLSAVRREGDRFQYQEASIRCGRPSASDAILEIWEEIDEGRAT